MIKKLILAGAMLAAITSCTMENPFLTESKAPYGAPEFDKIKTEHYMPAFEVAIAEAMAEIDAITSNQEEPTFENTIEAMEFAGQTLNKVAGVFYNVMEAHTNDDMQAIAEEIAPKMTEYSMYVSLNAPLFERVKAVYEKKDSLGLEKDQMTLLENSYKGFVRGGANLSEQDKELYRQYTGELSGLTLKFGQNSLAATNAFSYNITDAKLVEELPKFVKEGLAMEAKARGQKGWTVTLKAPSYGPFMTYSSQREIKEKLWKAYNSRALGGEFDNSDNIRKITALRNQF
jgi:peptidyl-dipeptidase Dcp